MTGARPVVAMGCALVLLAACNPIGTGNQAESMASSLPVATPCHMIPVATACSFTS